MYGRMLVSTTVARKWYSHAVRPLQAPVPPSALTVIDLAKKGQKQVGHDEQRHLKAAASLAWGAGSAAEGTLRPGRR
jgi:hypothetical protein